MKGITTNDDGSTSVAIDADRWELFDEEGRDEAAADLNAALAAALDAPGATPTSVRDAMGPVCARHDHLGADDGEAEAMVERAIRWKFRRD